MKPEDQIVAIAELDGWEPTPEGYFHPDNPTGQTPPPYLTSRDAIVPVIVKICESDEISCHNFCNYWREKQVFSAYHYCSLTPARLAEALLRATGKWKS